ncbi:MAG: cupin domain-containing protein [Bryobacteraceae bacterium]
MVTRREMYGSLTAAFAALAAGSTGTLLEAEPAPKQQHGPMNDIPSPPIKILMKEPLPEMPNPVLSVIVLTMEPGASSRPHKHIGPVFAYILEGEIENQVDPEPPKRYKAGDYFYEPRMHVHRMMRNLSKTKPAKLLISQVGEKGKAFTIPV